MEVSDQLHTVAVLLLRKEVPVFTGKELGGAPDQEWSGSKE